MNDGKEERIKQLDILLVDDNEDDVDIALRTFERLKMKNHVYVAHDGQEALDFIHHAKEFHDEFQYPTPDVIFLDISMPKVNGFEFLAAIKKSEDFSYIPVIMLSSSRNEKDVLKSFRLGAASYIPPETAEQRRILPRRGRAERFLASHPPSPKTNFRQTRLIPRVIILSIDHAFF